MTLEEFSNEFDVLLQSYSNLNMPLKFDEYEKSVFLTQAQNDLVKEFYTGINAQRKSFEETEEIRSYLSELVMTSSMLLTESSIKKNGFYIYRIKDIGTYPIGESGWFILYEEAWCSEEDKCLSKKVLQVVPVTHDNIYRLLQDPFKGPNNRRVLKVTKYKEGIELYSKYKLNLYNITYLMKPTPIILIDLPIEQNLRIENNYEKSECKLNSSLHRDILDRAVKLAVLSKSIGAQKS